MNGLKRISLATYKTIIALSSLLIIALFIWIPALVVFALWQTAPDTLASVRAFLNRFDCAISP